MAETIHEDQSLATVRANPFTYATLTLAIAAAGITGTQALTINGHLSKIHLVLPAMTGATQLIQLRSPDGRVWWQNADTQAESDITGVGSYNVDIVPAQPLITGMSFRIVSAGAEAAARAITADLVYAASSPKT